MHKNEIKVSSFDVIGGSIAPRMHSHNNEALLKVQNPQRNDSMLAEFACPDTVYLIKSHCYIIPANLAASEVYVLCQHCMHY